MNIVLLNARKHVVYIRDLSLNHLLHSVDSDSEEWHFELWVEDKTRTHLVHYVEPQLFH